MPSPLQSKWLCWASGWYPVDLSGNHLATKVCRFADFSPIAVHVHTCSKVFKRGRCFLGKGTGCLIHVWLSCVILVCRCCGCEIVFSLFAWTPKLPGIVDQRGSVQPPSYHPARPNLVTFARCKHFILKVQSIRTWVVRYEWKASKLIQQTQQHLEGVAALAALTYCIHHRFHQTLIVARLERPCMKPKRPRPSLAVSCCQLLHLWLFDCRLLSMLKTLMLSCLIMLDLLLKSLLEICVRGFVSA